MMRMGKDNFSQIMQETFPWKGSAHVSNSDSWCIEFWQIFIFSYAEHFIFSESCAAKLEKHKEMQKVEYVDQQHFLSFVRITLEIE